MRASEGLWGWPAGANAMVSGFTQRRSGMCFKGADLTIAPPSVCSWTIPCRFWLLLFLPTIETTISESTWHKSICTGCYFTLADLMRHLLFGWCGRHLRMERSSWWLVGSGLLQQAHPSATALLRPCWQTCRWANTSPDHHPGSPADVSFACNSSAL